MKKKGLQNGIGPLFEDYFDRAFKDNDHLLLLGDLHRTVIEQVERPLIQAVLKATDGNQSRAAQVLGLNRNTLRKKIKELGLWVL